MNTKNVTAYISEPSKRIAVAPEIRSDLLPKLHALASQLPELAPLLEDYLQIKLVIDANFVHQELQWRLKRRNPIARTRLHESVVSGVVILFAPTHLGSEIEDDLGEIAERSGATVDQARAEWKDFRSHLHFYTPLKLTLRRGIPIVDPDDLPYIAACNELGADAVYSKDKHLRQMEAPVISIAIDASLQSYARGSSVQLAVMVGSAFSVRLSAHAIKAVCAVLGKAYQYFKRLHPLLQFAIVAILVFVLADPKMRSRFTRVIKTLGKIALPVLAAVTAAAQQLEIASVKIDAAEEEIRGALPHAGRRTVLSRARCICLLSDKPLSLRELKNRF